MHDPAFEVDKTNGLYCCFNPSCAAAGTLEQLAYRVKGTNTFEFQRLVVEHRMPAYDMLQKLREQKPAEFNQFPEEPVQRMEQAMWHSVSGLNAQHYMHGRGFNDETLKHFGIGYSDKQDMVIVPMHDPKGMLIGFIGRSINGKRFKNSDGLPKSKTAWNYHRAKLHGDTVIVVESSFDAMRIHQAGYPNVVALLGGSLSSHHIEQLDKTFSTIVIMTDFDLLIRDSYCSKCHGKCRGHRPGRDLAWSIARSLPHKKIRWAVWDDFEVYPDGAKDASDLSDDYIASMLRAPITSLEYQMLDYDRLPVLQ